MRQPEGRFCEWNGVSGVVILSAESAILLKPATQAMVSGHAVACGSGLNESGSSPLGLWSRYAGFRGETTPPLTLLVNDGRFHQGIGGVASRRSDVACLATSVAGLLDSGLLR